MDSNNNTFGWVMGAVVVVLIIVGLWWFMQGSPSAPATDTNATTTPQVATSTEQAGSSGASSVASESRTGSTVAEVVASLGGSGASLLSSTGVSGSLTGKGPYTVFVPTDAAFGNLSPGTLSSMSAAQKKRLAQYHVVSGKMLDLDAVSSGTHVALSKDTLNFNVQEQTKIAYVGQGYAVRQYKASNGVVYVITAVLVPPQTPNPTTGSTGSPVPR